MTLASMAGAGWACPGTAANNCTRGDVLSAGASYPPITVSVNVLANAPAQVTNQFSVSGGGSATANASDPTTVVQPPLQVNLAQGKVAAQSSSPFGAPANRAVDGNTSGNWADNSVTHTDLNANAWWQVDLGASATLSSIVIWNRTDCCGDRLSDYWVFVSDTPFGPSDTPSTLQNRAGTWSNHQTSMPNPSVTVGASGVQGRYLRVQLSGTNYLSLAEVQVFAQ
jgi:hypothetical protein